MQAESEAVSIRKKRGKSKNQGQEAKPVKKMKFDPQQISKADNEGYVCVYGLSMHMVIFNCNTT